MDDYALYLASEAQSDIAALHQYKILYEPKSDAFHFFFEGEEDSLFYMPEARRLLNARQAHIYVCGGKANVVEVRQTIHTDGYNVDSCLFFVDRDFDDLLGTQVAVDQHTYLTDHYSIESDVSCLSSAEILLEDVVRLSRADPEFLRVLSDLEVAFSEFYNRVRSLSAWIIAAKEAGCGPNLKNTNGLTGIMAIGQKGIPLLTKVGFQSFRRKVLGNNQGPPIKTTLAWARRLTPQSHKLWVRGKYDVWFFQKALLSVLEESSARRKAAGGRALRVPAALREGRVFDILGGRVLPPVSLRSFLEGKLT